jgi:hypothetical protein
VTGPALLALSAVMLAQAPQAGRPEALAALYGRTLGAAAECEGITRTRLQAVAEKASAHLKTLAPSEVGQSAAAADLAKGVERGDRDVRSGAVTCAQAESEFANLEHDLAGR